MGNMNRRNFLRFICAGTALTILPEGCGKDDSPLQSNIFEQAKTTDLKVMVVGVDGATFDIIEPMIAAGKLPEFKRLMNTGTHARFRSQRPMFSPVLWTTIATGHNRKEHGIRYFVTRDEDGSGRRRLISTRKIHRGVVLRRSLFIITALVIITLVAVWYKVLCRDSAQVPSKNVVIIMLDTVRTDRLGCYGNPSGITPEIDKFGQGAIRFEQAFSHAPWTLPSVASLFTSQYPTQHGAGGYLGSFTILHDDAVTIAELFQRAGAVTGAITNVLFLTEKFGMTQGFDTVDATVPKQNILVRRAGPTTEAALRWLDQHSSKPFFLFVHYFDPHLMYDPPLQFRKRFADAQDADSNDCIFGTVRDMINLRQGLVKLDSQTIGRLEKLHNGEVAYTDAEVGKLLAGISERALDASTIVVITADHGEEFYDHGGFEHGHTFYDELLHIPLIVRAAGVGFMQTSADEPQARGFSVGTTVRHIDVAPTLCELVGIRPASSFMGESFVPLLKGHEGKDRSVLSQGNMWGPGGNSWRKDGFKLVQQSSTAECELFDISSDPCEQNDLADEIPRLCQAMMGDLNLILQAVSHQRISNKAPTLSDHEIEVLRSLGYVK